jgi:hypothetical protein
VGKLNYTAIYTIEGDEFVIGESESRENCRALAERHAQESAYTPAKPHWTRHLTADHREYFSPEGSIVNYMVMAEDHLR